jgi:diguanylate cyclase (GGDEF)-like protein
MYIDNIGQSYFFLIIIDLMLYVMVHVGLVYRRIGLNVKEEKEFSQAKIFAFTDELTKLGNRRHFYTMIEDYEKNKLPNNLTYIAIDVNKLKYVNDNIGHEAGDELLVGTAQCIKNAFSSSPTSTISRMGGDEFAVLLIASKNEVDTRIENMKIMLKKWKGKYIDGITVAVGCAAVYENPDLSINEISQIADKRMYEDKAAYYKATGEDRRTSR